MPEIDAFVERIAAIAAGVARDRAIELGAKEAIKTYESEKAKQSRRRSDRRMHDTKRLLMHYREIKVHAEDAIASLAEINDEDYDFFRRLMEDDRKVDVDSIVTSKVRSSIMLDQIDTMLHKYQQIAYSTRREEEMRRYRVLEAMCISDERKTVQEIAEMENIVDRTVYRDFDIACSRMGALLFGVQWIERNDE